jgi:hypothetical protein
MARGRLHTTTVRFDANTWAEIVAESDRLGVAHAEYIRGAVLRLIGGAGEHDRLLRLEVQCDQLTEEVQQVARAVVRIARSLKAARAAATEEAKTESFP